MLGNENIKNYISGSYANDTKPRAFLEFNGNDYGDPYLYGTGTRPPEAFADFDLTLNNRQYSPAPTTGVDAGLSIAISPNTDTAYSIDLTPGGNKFYEHGYYADAPNGVKNIKFNMFLKSDYLNKILIDNDYLESFDVLFYVYANDSTGKILKSETVSKTVTVNSINWEPVSILFCNPDDASSVRNVTLNMFISMREGEKVALLVDKLCYAEISDYEVFVENRLPLGTVFDINRPGEFLVDTPLADRPTISIGGVNIPQQPTQVHMCMAYALGPKYEPLQRSVAPYSSNPNIYYVSGSSSDSKSVWTIYKNSIKTNKIVIKVNAIALKPSTFSLHILDDSGWSTNLISSETFDNNGILILYYNGQSWSDVVPGTEDYPKIDLTSGTNSGNIVVGSNIAYKTIHGIHLDVDSFSVTNGDFSDLRGTAQRLELIEISPRLEVDVTDLLEFVSIKKEISDSESSLMFGGLSSNSYDIKLSNIGILQSDGSYKNPLNTNNEDSILYKLIRRMVKIRGGFDIDITNSEIGVSSSKYYVPSFVGYINSWSLEDSLSISAFDSIKFLQDRKTPPIYLSNARVAECLFSVMDAAGFSETYASDIFRLKIMSRSQSDIYIPSEKITHFWTSEDKNVSDTLNELARLFQFGVYCDEYGGVKVKSLYDFNKSYKNIISGELNPDMYIQDYNDSNSLSNIESDPKFVDMTIPSKLIIKYYDPHTPTDLIAADEIKDNSPTIENPTIKNVTNIVWTPDSDKEILPVIEIGVQGINGLHQNWIPYNVELTNNFTTTIPYSSHLLIDEEIVFYDGIEYEFRYTVENVSQPIVKNVKIKSEEELQSVQDSIFSENVVKTLQSRPTGKLVNVRRGLFGTVPGRHIRKNSSTDTHWKVKEFDITSSGYVNMSSVSRSTGKYGPTVDGFKLNSSSPSNILFMYPNDDETDINILKNKKRLSATINIGDVPDQKEGAVGIGAGIEISGGQIINGIIIWLSIDVKKKKQQPNIYVEQIVNGAKKMLISKSDFEYDEMLFDENENVEVFVGLNKNNSQVRVLIGGTSLYQKQIKDKKNKKKIKGIDQTFNLFTPLKQNSTFGMAARGSMSAVLDTMQFGVSRDPQDMNDLDIDNLDDEYQPKYTRRPNSTYFIGNESLLNNIASNQLIAGISQNSADNFVYTGSPVGRGIKIYEVKYDPYPITTNPEYEFTGYTYDLNLYQSSNIVGEGIVSLNREEAGPI